jgi:hypothetical protein
MGYFWLYLATETNSPNTTLIFGGSHRKQRTFGGLVWPGKINPTFGDNYLQRLLSVIFGNFFCGGRRNLKATKIIRSYFRRFFPSRRK